VPEFFIGRFKLKKVFLLLSFLSLPVVTFAYGKSFDTQDERPQTDSRKEENHKKDAKKTKEKDHGRDTKYNRERGKDIDAPRLRPQPRVVTTAASAQPIIINNNNVNNNNNVVQATTTSVATANAIQVAEPVRIAPEPRKIQTVSSQPVSTSTRTGYWDEGTYFGLGLRIGAGNLHQTGASYDKTFDPIGATFNMTLGYKMPMFRIGGEMGFGSFIADVPPAGAYAKEEDSITAFTLMPQVFFDMDFSQTSRIEPYIGFGAGLGVIGAKYDLFWYDDSSAPDKTNSANAANLVYAFMAGVRIALVPALELDFGYRFQDYGNVELLGYDNKLYANEFNLGIAFKF
jgi:opacity protein-like surface antigen